MKLIYMVTIVIIIQFVLWTVENANSFEDEFRIKIL